jgi:hypothetical protein
MSPGRATDNTIRFLSSVFVVMCGIVPPLCFSIKRFLVRTTHAQLPSVSIWPDRVPDSRLLAKTSESCPTAPLHGLQNLRRRLAVRDLSEEELAFPAQAVLTADNRDGNFRRPRMAGDCNDLDNGTNNRN